MATTETELGKKDIIIPQPRPVANPYYVTQIWILDETTCLPVGVRAEYTFSL